jgi:hypothetical protein
MKAWQNCLHVHASALMSFGIRVRRRAFSGSFTKRHTLFGNLVTLTYDGILVYTKGSIKRLEGKEYFYLLISSKKAIKN